MVLPRPTVNAEWPRMAGHVFGAYPWSWSCFGLIPPSLRPGSERMGVSP